MKKNGIITDSLLIDSECPDFIKQQLDTYEPINSLVFGKIGSADRPCLFPVIVPYKRF